MTSEKKTPAGRPGKADFSIDDFIKEIEKAEDAAASKPLYAERMRNKRRLDREDAKAAAEAQETPRLAGKGKDNAEANARRLSEAAGGKSKRSAATGMTLKAPKSKANSVERPTNLDGFAEAPQAGFHSPATVQSTTSGVSATVAALENIIAEGRKEVEGNEAWKPHRPAPLKKDRAGIPFNLVTDYTPPGDQPTAIAELVEGISNGETDQVLLGVTGSGKTFTAAQVIAATQRPALILAPNKTLAAQLYGEFKNFFPENAVEYFVSYYDYYQPEAYVPRTDTYIEKESTINEQIDRMRHSATRAILERDDVIIVASVSCIYGIGSVEDYTAMTIFLEKGQR